AEGWSPRGRRSRWQGRRRATPGGTCIRCSSAAGSRRQVGACRLRRRRRRRSDRGSGVSARRRETSARGDLRSGWPAHRLGAVLAAGGDGSAQLGRGAAHGGAGPRDDRAEAGRGGSLLGWAIPLDDCVARGGGAPDPAASPCAACRAGAVEAWGAGKSGGGPSGRAAGGGGVVVTAET